MGLKPILHIYIFYTFLKHIVRINNSTNDKAGGGFGISEHHKDYIQCYSTVASDKEFMKDNTYDDNIQWLNIESLHIAYLLVTCSLHFLCRG